MIVPVRIGVCLALALVALAAPAAAQTPVGIVRPQNETGTSLRELGSELYAGNCSTCHGIDGRGVGPGNPQRGTGDITGLGPPLRGVGALASDFYLRTGYMPLEKPGDQPSRTRVLFRDREIRALNAYVASLAGGPAIPVPRPAEGRLSDGLQLFTEHCAGCHQVAAQGGVVTGAKVPPLANATATQIAEAVRIGPYLMPRFSARQIDDRELNSIIRYVLLSQHPQDRGGLGIGNLGPFPEGIVTLLAIILIALGCAVVGKRARS